MQTALCCVCLNDFPSERRLLQLFQKLDTVQDFPFRRFLHFPRQHEFVENTVNLVEVEDNIQLANVGKVGIQEFYKQVDGFQVGEFVLLNVHGDGKEQTRISSIYEFVAIVFDKVCVFFVAGCHQSVNLGFNAGLLRFGCRGRSRGRCRRWRNIPFRQSGFPLSILEQKEPNLRTPTSQEKEEQRMISDGSRTISHIQRKQQMGVRRRKRHVINLIVQYRQSSDLTILYTQYVDVVKDKRLE